MINRSPAFAPGSQVAVLGLGVSGAAAARLAHARGASVYASDSQAGAEQVAVATELRALGISVDTGLHDLARLDAADLAVVSPGIGPNTLVRRRLVDSSVRTISEIELAFRDLHGRLIGITGTNGKTTVTRLLTHVLEQGGFDVACAGNVGVPLSDIVLRSEQPDWVVAELSSFQLADLEEFSSDIGVLLNLGPDHLDRYEELGEYYEDKKQLFARSSRDSTWILNADEPATLDLAAEAKGKRHLFSVRGEVPSGAWLQDGRLVARLPDGERQWLMARDLSLPGIHGIKNSLAAALTAACVGCCDEAIRSGLQSFQGLSHRLQSVAEVGGVLWVDDSKATNLSATEAALESFLRPIVLLLGGRHKGASYGRLVDVMADRVRAVVAFGEAARLIDEELGSSVRVVRAESEMESVVLVAAELAQPGDVVLLSPACSSYDMFSDYEARGRAFQHEIRQLGGERGTAT